MIDGLACVCAAERGAVDRVLQEVAAELAAQGWYLAGAVQLNCNAAEDALCDMDIRVLPAGRVYRISQNLGREATGCRLNPDQLECAVAEVASGLAQTRPDLLIVNKFGKMEAEGRGFRDLIGQALVNGVPVLVGVNDGNLAALEEFLGETPPLVEPKSTALIQWANALRAAAHHA